MWAELGSIAIFVFRNIADKLFLYVKVFDPGLNVLEICVHKPLGKCVYQEYISDKWEEIVA